MGHLLSTLLGAILCLTVGMGAASAQQPDRVYKIGYLSLARQGYVMPPFEKWPGSNGAFRDALRDRGYVAGKNLVVDLRHGDGDMARLDTEAAALAASDVDLIVTRGTAATQAVMKATTRIPIVFLEVGNPVGKNIVASLAKPGGNVTGIAVQIAGPKMYQLIKEAAPALRRVAHVGYGPAYQAPTVTPNWAAEAKAVAAENSLEWSDLLLSSREEINAKFAEFARGGAAGLIIVSDITISLWSEYILATAVQNGLVTACNDLGWARSGCALSYADDNFVRLRRGAEIVDKVLKGGKPAEIPVEQPTHIKLIINAKTMNALGLPIPPTLLALAEEVIE